MQGSCARRRGVQGVSGPALATLGPYGHRTEPCPVLVLDQDGLKLATVGGLLDRLAPRHVALVRAITDDDTGFADFADYVYKAPAGSVGKGEVWIGIRKDSQLDIADAFT